jgi:hypothetical protein
MSANKSIVAATLFLLVSVYFCVDTIWGDLADKTYDSRMKSLFRRLWMPGPLSRREVWVRYQKTLAAVGLPFVLLVYLAILAKVLDWRFPFFQP